MTLDSQVVALEKEKDPSILTAPYAGKLTRYLVKVRQDQGCGTPLASLAAHAATRNAVPIIALGQPPPCLDRTARTCVAENRLPRLRS